MYPADQVPVVTQETVQIVGFIQSGPALLRLVAQPFPVAFNVSLLIADGHQPAQGASPSVS